MRREQRHLRLHWGRLAQAHNHLVRAPVHAHPHHPKPHSVFDHLTLMQVTSCVHAHARCSPTNPLCGLLNFSVFSFSVHVAVAYPWSIVCRRMLLQQSPFGCRRSRVLCQPSPIGWPHRFDVCVCVSRTSPSWLKARLKKKSILKRSIKCSARPTSKRTPTKL